MAHTGKGSGATAAAPTILILAGGLSHERDVSLRSGRRVAEALREAGCTVLESDLDQNLLPTLNRQAVDLVWPLLHGAQGEDGSVRDVLALMGIPYLGSDARAARTAWNKAIAKSIVRRAGLATPDFVTFPKSLFRELGPAGLLQVIESSMGLPLVVKPLHGGSALGMSVVPDGAGLPQAMMDCFAYAEVALIERAVTGTELAVSVIDLGDGPFALPAVEIETTDGSYDYDARYNPGRTEFFAPARVSTEVAATAAAMAVTAHHELGLTRISRTDMIVDGDGVPWFLEVNVAPGMQETSLLPQAALAAGYELPRLYRDLAQASIDAG
ncbi:MAG: D-alanine--D-alanine ligase [Bifidobacteriaceae bacterium]|jgi:D-alanine-D-alanine ligase|nr:D-alanine--D-alanine ligase [Bifidobacteriaceae bacterium]